MRVSRAPLRGVRGVNGNGNQQPEYLINRHRPARLDRRDNSLSSGGQIHPGQVAVIFLTIPTPSIAVRLPILCHHEHKAFLPLY
jgi:hypothetical protein